MYPQLPIIIHPLFGAVSDLSARISIPSFNTVNFTQTPSIRRPDEIADKYYKNGKDDWTMLFANRQTNLLDLVYLEPDEFERTIIQQYGSILASQEKTAYYRSSKQIENISPAQFDVIPFEQRRYWTPVLTVYGEATQYKRTNTNVRYYTNRIVRIETDRSLPTSIIGEVIPIGNGVAEVEGVDQSILTLSNTRYTNQPDDITIAGEQFAVVSYVVLATNVSASVADVFERVSVFQHLFEQNEEKAKLKLIPAEQLFSFVNRVSINDRL